MEKLNEQDEVEDVEKAFISKVESYSDVDSLFWNKADIPLKSKRDIKQKFRRSIFSKCYLWDTFKTFDGDCSR